MKFKVAASLENSGTNIYKESQFHEVKKYHLSFLKAKTTLNDTIMFIDILIVINLPTFLKRELCYSKYYYGGL